ncbi:MAG: hypothetical protein ACYTGX_11030 [Planctomycetota bacterium]|jgi:hypothetical protein
MGQLKGNYVTFRRQTREQDRDSASHTEHYIIEGDGRSYLGYVTVRRLSDPAEIAATVLVNETGVWEQPEGKDILRAIEKYAFATSDSPQLALELSGQDEAALKRLNDSGFRARDEKGRGRTVVLVKERSEN